MGQTWNKKVTRNEAKTEHIYRQQQNETKWNTYG